MQKWTASTPILYVFDLKLTTHSDLKNSIAEFLVLLTEIFRVISLTFAYLHLGPLFIYVLDALYRWPNIKKRVNATWLWRPGYFKTAISATYFQVHCHQWLISYSVICCPAIKWTHINAENVSMWWRNHVLSGLCIIGYPAETRLKPNSLLKKNICPYPISQIPNWAILHRTRQYQCHVMC